MKKTDIIILLCVFVASVFGGFIISGYNNLVNLQQAINVKTGYLQSALQRRYDLIPNLVEVVRKYSEHEANTLKEVINARGGNVGKLVSVLQENYPQLKADQQFLALQAELAGTENRINVSRQDREKSIGEYNTSRLNISGRIISVFAYFPEISNSSVSFEVEQAPRIKF